MDMYQNREMRKNKKMNEDKKSLPSTNINWYPGHMAKTKRLIREKLNQIDIVFEVIDARIPYSSKIIDIDEFIQNKPKLLIVTKYDLCDKKETKKWINNYERKGYQTICMDLNTDHIKNKIIEKTNILMKEKNDNRIEKGMNIRKPRVLIVGIPNVGKSTLINHLVGKKTVVTGNKPGVTKNLDWIRVGDAFELLDSPGILWPKFENETVAFNLASFTAIKEEILPTEKVVCYILSMLLKYYPKILKERYGIDSLDEDFIEAFETIGRKRGCLVKGGQIDYDKVCTVVMNDIKDGTIKNITFDRFYEKGIE